MTARFILRPNAQKYHAWNVWTMPHIPAHIKCMSSISSFTLYSVHFDFGVYFSCCNITTTAKMWIKIHFNTYPNQRLHFVRLCWRSINQLSSIERFALTIWVWRAGVFQQISLSSLFMCVSGASVESTSKKRDAIECQLIHRRNWWNLLSLSLWQLMMNALLTK